MHHLTCDRCRKDLLAADKRQAFCDYSGRRIYDFCVPCAQEVRLFMGSLRTVVRTDCGYQSPHYLGKCKPATSLGAEAHNCCPECGVRWCELSPECPRKRYDRHPNPTGNEVVKACRSCGSREWTSNNGIVATCHSCGRTGTLTIVSLG